MKPWSTVYPETTYSTTYEPDTLTLFGSRRVFGARGAARLRAVIGRPEFTRRLSAGTRLHYAAIIAYAAATNKSFSALVLQALGDEQEQRRGSLPSSSASACCCSMSGATWRVWRRQPATYRLPVVPEESLRIEWARATETHPRVAYGRQVIAEYAGALGTMHTYTEGGGQPPYYLRDPYTSAAEATLHVALTRIGLVYAAGTLTLTLPGTTVPQPRQELTDLPASVVREWPRWMIRNVRQQWSGQGWLTTLTAVPLPERVPDDDGTVTCQWQAELHEGLCARVGPSCRR